MIRLFTSDHDLIIEKKWHSIDFARMIAQEWINAYSEMAGGVYIQFVPYPRMYVKKEKIIIEPEKPERPPASYTNIPTYNYEDKKNGHGT